MKRVDIKIVTIGNATKDIFIHHNDDDNIKLYLDHMDSKYLLFKDGSKIEINNLHIASGGGATNAAVCFKKIGFNSICYTKVGNDESGKFVLQDLQNYGIDVNYIKVDNNIDTPSSFIITSSRKRSSTFVYRGKNNIFSFQDLYKICSYKPNLVYITSLGYTCRKAINHFLSNLNKNKTIVVNNPGLVELQYDIDLFYTKLKYIDILILNKIEAMYCMQLLLEEQSIIAKDLQKKICSKSKKPPLLEFFMSYANRELTIYNYFYELFKHGPYVAIVTDGENGAYVAVKDDAIYYLPSLKVNVLNTVGAGDAFGSTFVSAILLKKNIQDAIYYATINSASVVQHLDAKSGLLTLDELDDKLLYLLLDDIRIFPI
jgi:sugar/nucleoside kinase (ribokinase family)